ncbi:MAG TPA: HAD-IA family hydrolase [Gemmatimonadaceae bacterium]|jgi:putative hydrolase of the HAD superfamily
MSDAIDWVLFDVGGVLGTNAWDREQRAEAVATFGLDGDDFQYRHEEMVGAFESGEVTLDEYLAITVFCVPRSFSPDDFKKFMFAQSVAWPDSIAVARELAASRAVRLATLNNESEELNRFRIESWGLRDIFPTFFTSCWLGVRKPTRHVYERVLGMTQSNPKRTVFIDDRLQNLAPAAALGVRTVQFTKAETLRADLMALGLLV